MHSYSCSMHIVESGNDSHACARCCTLRTYGRTRTPNCQIINARDTLARQHLRSNEPHDLRPSRVDGVPRGGGGRSTDSHFKHTYATSGRVHGAGRPLPEAHPQFAAAQAYRRGLWRATKTVETRRFEEQQVEPPWWETELAASIHQTLRERETAIGDIQFRSPQLEQR